MGFVRLGRFLAVADPFELLDDREKKKLKRKRHPRWIEPMKATLAKQAFSDPDWIFEPKLDGERCIAYVKKSTVRLLSRNQKSTNSSYPELVDALASQGLEDAVLDGEVVAFDGDAPSFSALQRRMHVIDPNKARATGVKVGYHIFDIVHLDGFDVTAVPLVLRKRILKAAVRFNSPLHTSRRCARGRDGRGSLRNERTGLTCTVVRRTG